MRLLLALLASAFSLLAQTGTPVVHWVSQTNPAGVPYFNGFLIDRADGQGHIFHYGIPNLSASIYSSSDWYYSITSNTWVNGNHLYNRAVNSCTIDTATKMGDRHPGQSIALDTLRNVMWLAGGVNQGCTSGGNGNISGATVSINSGLADPSWVGTVVQVCVSGAPCVSPTNYTVASVGPGGCTASCTSWTATTTITCGGGGQPPCSSAYYQVGPPTFNYQDTYYVTLNANPASNTFNSVNVTSSPCGNCNDETAMAYLPPPIDALISFGGAYGNPFATQVFCPTDHNPTPGTLTANQTAIGCVSSALWAAVTVTCTGNCSSAQSPLGIQYPGIWWDDATSRVILFAGQTSGLTGACGGASVYCGETWSYAPLTKAWTQKCVSACTAPPVYTGAGTAQPAMDRISKGKFLFHETVGTGAPADYLYDTQADTWTKLTTTGSGTTDQAYFTFDPTSGKGMSWSGPTGGSPPAIWQAALEYPLSQTLTVQEALYPCTGTPGCTTGIARTSEPYCSGIPLPQNQGIFDTTTMNISGAAGQFRILGKWPNGSASWMEVCGLASLSAGGTATPTWSNNGSGNFGGSNLCTDGATISCATGTITATIKKTNFNLFDVVDVGMTHVILTGASSGLVLTGPSATASYPANVTCTPDTGGGACTTAYSSANDGSSTCAIEINGPIYSDLMCTGNLIDGAAHKYIPYTVRLYFYLNRSGVKATVVLRNANYDLTVPSPDRGGGTTNTAFKGMRSFEARITPNITGTLTYTIANETGTPTTGTLNQGGGTDTAVLYQAETTKMVGDCSAGACANQWTPDTGYTIKKNGSTVASGNTTAWTQGWADISNASGVGVEIGVYQLAAYWPKSLEFDAGGADVRIGMWPSENSINHYSNWPQWESFDLFFEFHATAPASLSDDFLKFQHYLVARPSVAWFNSTNIFPYTIPTASDEDTYLQSLAAPSSPALGVGSFCANMGGPCLNDLGTSNSNWPLVTQRWFNWGAGGGSHKQQDFRMVDLLNYIKRGDTGFFLNAIYHYKMEMETTWPHSDGTTGSSAVNGFKWSDRPNAFAGTPELDTAGNPQACNGQSCMTVANSGLGVYGGNNWVNIDLFEHMHWWSVLYGYFMTGDETLREGIVSMESYYLNDGTANGCWGVSACPLYADTSYYLPTTRAVALEMLNAGVFSEWLGEIGDTTNAATILTQGTHAWTTQVLPDPCVNGFPTGCTVPPTFTYPSGGTAQDLPGFDKNRGLHVGNSSRGFAWCAGTIVNTVNSGGNTLVTATSGYAFQSTMVGAPLFLAPPGGSGYVQYTVASFTDSTHITLAGNAGTQTGWVLQGFIRGNDQTFYSTLVDGLSWIRRVQGPSWQYYEQVLDYSYGLGQYIDGELFQDNGSGVWNVGNITYPEFNGFVTGGISFDIPQVCSAGTAGVNYNHGPLQSLNGHLFDPYTVAAAAFGVWMGYYAESQTTGSLTAAQQRRISLAVDWQANAQGSTSVDFGGYQLGTAIQAIAHPSSNSLQTVNITSVTNLGGNVYNVVFTPPAGAVSLRVKWSPATIQDTLGFDPIINNTFTLSPSTNATWFGANTTVEPAPTPGVQQAVQISTGVGGLTLTNFSVKAMAPNGASAGGSVVGGALKLGGNIGIH